MELLIFTVIILLCLSNDDAKRPHCNHRNGSHCKDLVVDHAQVCYKKSSGGLRADITCSIGRLKGPKTYRCQGTAVDWTPLFSSSCDTISPSTVTLSSPSSATTKSTETRTLITKETSDVTPVANTDNTEMAYSSVPVTSFTQSVSGSRQKTTFVSTTKYKTETEKNSNNTTQSKGKVPHSSEESRSAVIPAVLVSVVVVITPTVVIVFLLWRRRLLKQQKPMGGNSGRSVSNRCYEDNNGFSRHISLPIMRPDDLLHSEYAEISPYNLDEEKTAGGVYHTGINLPEDKTKCDDGYSHVKIQITKSIDNSYSHIAVKQTSSKASSNANYDLRGIASNAQELTDEGDSEITYDHLQMNVDKSKQSRQVLEKEEKNNSDNEEGEYNHAKAGHLSFVFDNKGDSYSHLNHFSQKPANQPNEQNPKTHANDTGFYGTKTQRLDADNNDKGNFMKQVGCNGYEMPSGTAHIYFTLKPEGKNSDANISFQVKKDLLQDSECMERTDHQYFILEKTDNDT